MFMYMTYTVYIDPNILTSESFFLVLVVDIAKRKELVYLAARFTMGAIMYAGSVASGVIRAMDLGCRGPS